MKNEIIKTDPKEYGIEESKAKTIQDAFAPKIAERDGYLKVYETLISAEITHDICIQAKELRKKLSKVRTGMAKSHKAEKAFALAYGKLCDAWKNKETLPITQMEEKLSEIENYFEKQEQERINKLSEEREIEISKYLEPGSVAPSDLGRMQDEIWSSYLLGTKASHEARIEAEKKAEEKRIEAENKVLAEKKEKERVEKLHNERKELALPFYNYWSDFEKTLNFGKVSYSDFKDFMSRNEAAKIEYDNKQAAIKTENDRLKREKEEKEKAAKIEAKKKSERVGEMQPYIVFIRDYNKMLNLPDAEYSKELSDVVKGANDHWEHERKEKARKEKAEKIANDKRIKLEKELKAKEKAEKEEKERLAKIEAAKDEYDRLAALAPEKEKIQKWIYEFNIPEFDMTNVSGAGKATIETITNKFNAFKIWAESQSETIK